MTRQSSPASLSSVPWPPRSTIVFPTSSASPPTIYPKKRGKNSRTLPQSPVKSSRSRRCSRSRACLATLHSSSKSSSKTSTTSRVTLTWLLSTNLSSSKSRHSRFQSWVVNRSARPARSCLTCPSMCHSLRKLWPSASFRNAKTSSLTSSLHRSPR